MVTIVIEQLWTRSHPDKDSTINRRKLVICTFIKDMNEKKCDLLLVREQLINKRHNFD